MGSNFANDLALADNLDIEIDAVNDAGLWDLEIPMPEGVTYKGLTTAPAHAIIEQHHLHSWLIEREEY
jgi:hypothetical protein